MLYNLLHTKNYCELNTGHILIQTVLLQFQIKRAPADTQQFGSGFPIIPRGFQRFPDSCPFRPRVIQRIDFCLFGLIRQVHVFRSNPVVFRQQGGTFHRSFQFTYVSRSRVRFQPFLCLPVKAFHVLSQFPVCEVEHELRQWDNIFGALCQQRHIQRKFIQPVKQVFSEPALRYRPFQILHTHNVLKFHRQRTFADVESPFRNFLSVSAV